MHAVKNVMALQHRFCESRLANMDGAVRVVGYVLAEICSGLPKVLELVLVFLQRVKFSDEGAPERCDEEVVH